MADKLATDRGSAARDTDPDISAATLNRAEEQRVIDALMDEEGAKHSRHADTGLSWKAIKRCGRELGMTDGFIKGCRLSGSQPAMRVCVRCDARFLSTGVHNRVCRRCR